MINIKNFFIAFQVLLNCRHKVTKSFCIMRRKQKYLVRLMKVFGGFHYEYIAIDKEFIKFRFFGYLVDC